MKGKKLSKSLARKETDEGEAEDAGGDSLPAYARTYILPRKLTLAGQPLPATRTKFDPSLVKEETMLTMEKMKTLVPCVGTERLSWKKGVSRQVAEDSAHYERMNTRCV